MQKLLRFAWACIIVALLVLGGSWLYEHYQPFHKASESTNTAATLAYRIDNTALSSQVNAILAENSDLDISVSIADLQTGTAYHYGDTASYTAASISKLITASLYLHRVEIGQASLDDLVADEPAHAQLEKMIVDSDNAAWHNLNTALGGAPALQSYAHSIGLASYDATTNTVTSDDIALLLTKLCGLALLDNANTQVLLGLMQQANMRSYIVAAVPAGADIYHKVGYLSDRLHDVAVIKKGGRSFALVIFSKSAGAYDFGRGAALFGSITGITLQTFFGT